MRRGCVQRGVALQSKISRERVSNISEYRWVFFSLVLCPWRFTDLFESNDSNSVFNFDDLPYAERPTCAGTSRDDRGSV